MHDFPHSPEEEAITCSVCEQHIFWLMEGEAAQCPICQRWTHYGEPPDENDD